MSKSWNHKNYMRNKLKAITDREKQLEGYYEEQILFEEE